MTLKERYDREVARMRAEDEDYQKAELMLAVSERMRQLMAESGKTRQSLAKDLGVSRQYVTKLLNDEDHNFSLWQLARFAKALDAKLEWDFQPLAALAVVARSRWSCQTNVSTLYYSMQERGSDALSLAA